MKKYLREFIMEYMSYKKVFTCGSTFIICFVCTCMCTFVIGKTNYFKMFLIGHQAVLLIVASFTSGDGLFSSFKLCFMIEICLSQVSWITIIHFVFGVIAYPSRSTGFIQDFLVGFVLLIILVFCLCFLSIIFVCLSSSWGLSAHGCQCQCRWIVHFWSGFSYVWGLLPQAQVSWITIIHFVFGKELFPIIKFPIFGFWRCPTMIFEIILK
jgi:hypothetical protein